MTDLKTLKELIKLMAANDLTELDLQDPKGERVTLKRGSGSGPIQYVNVPAPAVVAPPASTSVAASGGSGTSDASDAGLTPIPSPMVGTFYAASAPDAKPFASAGDRITPDKVVCIIEAMKVFNEIKAEISGTIVKVMVSNGEAVEFGQTLFLVKPN
ncbi:MAG: acetyl-CoA carboxylase biotin carboxyl carrier protein [Phycisphaeraceae bacterium]|nr:acetyl-CoA carboxylase biotin carboxyl carrier protein [Phycisphaeraceae bacterium]